MKFIVKLDRESVFAQRMQIADINIFTRLYFVIILEKYCNFGHLIIVLVTRAIQKKRFIEAISITIHRLEFNVIGKSI